MSTWITPHQKQKKQKTNIERRKMCSLAAQWIRWYRRNEKSSTITSFSSYVICVIFLFVYHSLAQHTHKRKKNLLELRWQCEYIHHISEIYVSIGFTNRYCIFENQQTSKLTWIWSGISFFVKSVPSIFQPIYSEEKCKVSVLLCTIFFSLQ